MESSNIYDEIVEEYSQAKSNPYKQYVEEPTFWSCAGKDFSGKTVLDLACGSGHYSRQFRIYGAHQVVGVDISNEMIVEAKKLGDPSDKEGGLTYITADATDQGAYMPLNKDGFDLVTSQYLFPYANTKDELLKMCKAAFSALKSGGSYVGVTTWLDSDNPPKAQSAILGYEMTWDGSNDGVALHDGVGVLITLLDNKGQKTVSFPNYLWSKETISKFLKDVGFSVVEWHKETDGKNVLECPQDSSLVEANKWITAAREDFGICGYFVAYK